MEKLNNEEAFEIKECLKRKTNSIKKYIYIMENLHNPQNKKEVIEKYKDFYKMNAARLLQEFYNLYFDYLYENKDNTDITFEEIIRHLYNPKVSYLNKIQSSFSSKLLATINPNMVIWDTNVLYRLRNKIDKEYIVIYKYKNKKTNTEKIGYRLKGDKIKSTIVVYDKLNTIEQKLLKGDGKEYIKIFNETYQEMFKDDENILKFKDKISDIKKLDFVLWSLEKK